MSVPLPLRGPLYMPNGRFKSLLLHLNPMNKIIQTSNFTHLKDAVLHRSSLHLFNGCYQVYMFLHKKTSQTLGVFITSNKNAQIVYIKIFIVTILLHNCLQDSFPPSSFWKLLSCNIHLMCTFPLISLFGNSQIYQPIFAHSS